MNYAKIGLGVAAGAGAFAAGEAARRATDNGTAALVGTAGGATVAGLAATRVKGNGFAALIGAAGGLAASAAFDGVQKLRAPKVGGVILPTGPGTDPGGNIDATGGPQSTRPRDQLLPNIVPLAPDRFSISGSGNNRHLQFGTYTANLGEGAFELSLKDNTPGAKVQQNIYGTDGRFTQHQIGRDGMGGTNGGSRDALKFDDFAQYTLFKADRNGVPTNTIVESHPKMSFLIIDTDQITDKLDPTGARAVNRDQNGYTIQGVSPGQADQYGPGLCGQDFDISGLPDGDYVVRQQMDPNNIFIESDDHDNTRDTLVRIHGNDATILRSGPPTTARYDGSGATVKDKGADTNPGGGIFGPPAPQGPPAA